MSFGSNVGITWREAFGGSVGANERMSVRLDVSIPSLTAYLESADPAATITGGEVEWKGQRVPVRPGGTLRPYHRVEGQDRVSMSIYEFSFAPAAGPPLNVRAEKKLKSDILGGLDATGDLTTLRVTVSGGAGGPVSGVLQVRIDEVVRQYQSVQVQGADTQTEAHDAREAFLGYINSELRHVYPSFPLLFSTETRLSEEQWRTLRLAIQIFGPSPLPASGPTVDDTVRELQKFITHASSPDLGTIRTLLQVVGIFISGQPGGVDGIRKRVRQELEGEKNTAIRASLEQLHNLVSFAYYGSSHADAMVGYARPVHRPNHHTRLRFRDVPPADEFDVVIAGTGPAGSLLADRLSAAGKRVLLLEAGPYVPEEEIGPDELLGIARLYRQSGLQAANRPATPFDAPKGVLAVLQGGCVGGGGVVNNAICFPLPEKRLAAWQGLGFPFTAAQMGSAYAAVAADLEIGDAAAEAKRLNPAGAALEAIFGKAKVPPLDRPTPPGFYRMLLNLEHGDGGDRGCRSTGLCNVGCGSERKRNTQQVYLKRAVNEHGAVLVPEARVVDVRTRRAGAELVIDGFLVETSDGHRVLVHGREYVLACGAVSSTAVLLGARDDGIRELRQRLPVGDRFSANLASPMFGFATQPVHRETSVQMAHVLLPEDAERGWLLETWFSPPGGLALAMPGYLNTHHERMMRYRTILCAAPVVGSQAHGTVRIRGGRPDVQLALTPWEVGELRTANRRAAEALLAVRTDGMRVDEVVVRFGGGRSLKNAADVARLDAEMAAVGPAQHYMLPLSTAHPQGGNALSTDPAVGVVDGDFRVRGTRNLRICDGSVFPDCARVNPQWTIMALAHLCAHSILSA